LAQATADRVSVAVGVAKEARGKSVRRCRRCGTRLRNVGVGEGGTGVAVIVGVGEGGTSVNVAVGVGTAIFVQVGVE
jgi:hypothetical protein